MLQYAVVLSLVMMVVDLLIYDFSFNLFPASHYFFAMILFGVDKWVSTLHRVILPPMDGQQHRRQSIAYFVNINGDSLVTTLETCVDEQNPPKYPPISAREHLMNKHLASMRAVEQATTLKEEL